MKVKMHSDVLTKVDVVDAAAIARRVHLQDVFVDEIIEHGSRSRAREITFYCESLDGRRAPGRRRGQESRAASWTAWGWVIAELFSRDPNAKIGDYDGVDDFGRKCRERYGEYQKRNGDTLDFLALVEKKAMA